MTCTRTLSKVLFCPYFYLFNLAASTHLFLMLEDILSPDFRSMLMFLGSRLLFLIASNAVLLNTLKKSPRFLFFIFHLFSCVWFRSQIFLKDYALVYASHIWVSDDLAIFCTLFCSNKKKMLEDISNLNNFFLLIFYFFFLLLPMKRLIKK